MYLCDLIWSHENNTVIQYVFFTDHRNLFWNLCSKFPTIIGFHSHFFDAKMFHRMKDVELMISGTNVFLKMWLCIHHCFYEVLQHIHTIDSRHLEPRFSGIFDICNHFRRFLWFALRKFIKETRKAFKRFYTEGDFKNKQQKCMNKVYRNLWLGTRIIIFVAQRTCRT